MRLAYDKLSHVIRNNTTVILRRLEQCSFCKYNIKDDITKRVLEIKEALDGRTGDDDAIPVDTSGSGDAPETEGV